MLEILDYLQNTNKIEDIDIDDLRDLLLSQNKVYKNFNLKMMTKDSLVVYNKNTRKNSMVRCVKNYYDLEDLRCMPLKEKIGINLNHGCRECHLKCLRMYENNSINKL